MTSTTILASVAGLILLYVTYRIAKSWIEFRRDDIIVINGQEHSLDAVFESISREIGLQGRVKSLIRYSFLRGRRQIAAYQEREGIPLEATVAFFMAGSALGYAKTMQESNREHELTEFSRIAESAKAYGERFAPSQGVF